MASPRNPKPTTQDDGKILHNAACECFNFCSLSAELRTALARKTQMAGTLKAVGYWLSSDSQDDDLPDPRLLVRKNWCRGEKTLILSYLKSGSTFARWRGFSYCRFRCGAPYAEIGSRCLTDGIWVWPEGLAHYLK